MPGPDLLVLREILRIGASLLIGSYFARAGFYGVCVSTFPALLHGGYLLSHSVLRSHSATFWISLRGY